jgi:hypothetical protein
MHLVCVRVCVNYKIPAIFEGSVCLAQSGACCNIEDIVVELSFTWLYCLLREVRSLTFKTYPFLPAERKELYC